MAVELFYSESIPQQSLPPAMKFLLTKWTTLAGMSRLGLQAITDSKNFNIADNSAYMVGAGDDFFFMHMGKAVRTAIGDDFTGRLLSEVNDTVARDLLDAYREAVARQRPIFMRFTSSIAQNALVWQRLVLPIPVERLGTILVCYSEVLSHHHAVFEFLFRTARHPGLVTYPIFNAEQELDDGWVLLMNDAARAAFSYDRPIGNLRLRELPLFQFGGLWTKLRERYPLANPRATLTFDRLELDLIKVNHLLAYRFATSAAKEGSLA